MAYTVTRQRQWPEGLPVVEVSRGGLDYTNPDALCPRYPGEMQTYDSPVEAVETAIAICKAWRKEGERDAVPGVGATLGMTMPFGATTFREARRWARKELEGLPKCDRCGELLPPRPYKMLDTDGEYCSEYCAEQDCTEEIETTE